MRRSYKLRIYPTKVQTERLERTLDLLRNLYNSGLQERRDAWKLNRIAIGLYDQQRQLKDIRAENPEYQSVLARTLECTLRSLDKTFSAFFKRIKKGQKAGYPRFKGRAFFNSIVYNQSGYRFNESKLNLSFIGDLKIKINRPIDGKIKEVIAKREGAKWYAVLACDDVPERPLPPIGSAVGVDVGIESFATLSDGTQIDNWRFYESAQRELRKAQRRVSRRVKGSNRRKKAVAVLRNIHQKIFNRRSDFQHKVSAHLISTNDLIAVEDLNIAFLAKGKLAKQIKDVAWGAFIHKLMYKAESAGRQVVAVNPNFTSQDCSNCGNRVKKDLKIRVHNCDGCGLSLNRDWNAALNILARA